MRNLRRRNAFLIDREFTSGELVAKISLCVENDVGEVFATPFIETFSTFASLVSHALVSKISQTFGSHSSGLGHLYITLFI